MSAAYDAAPWSDLFVATAGAGAALAGLVFVAISINVSRILAMPGQAERGLQTIMLLLAVVIVSVCGLIPQPIEALGVELVVTGGIPAGWIAVSMRKSLETARGHPVWIVSRFALFVPGSVCYIVAGFSVLTAAGGGLFWLAGGILAAVIGAGITAWVLLVEILRWQPLDQDGSDDGS